MATTEDGTLDIVPVTAAQLNKTTSFNGHVTALTKSGVGILAYDADGQTGTQILTQQQSLNGIIQISGALAGALTLELDADITQAYWVHDVSTGYNVTVRSTGGAGTIMPKNQWVLYYAATDFFTPSMSGWQATAAAPALSFGTGYQVVSGRELTLHKEGENTTIAGGHVALEGAVEDGGDAPAAGDVIVTLPANYRPGHAIGFIVLADPATAALAEPVAIEIQSDGTVVLRSLLNWSPVIDTPTDLSGVSFFVGN